MKINWKLRFTNKVTLTAIVAASLALIYQIFGLFGIVPTISKSALMEVAGLAINLAVLLGIVTDPTTTGASDSERAMEYKEPN